ncbi:uncharacterized protein DS421_19g639710 [Arachis hypogaea]|uniref:Uncharacterized protein n=1 Tax=Arachis hypogaea TaxID=3818 RepID=A0A6B9V5J1_ARAHY|nr:uncharacterized protein DS421_19g639710 [Arachis hypogaea]
MENKGTRHGYGTSFSKTWEKKSNCPIFLLKKFSPTNRTVQFVLEGEFEFWQAN